MARDQENGKTKEHRNSLQCLIFSENGWILIKAVPSTFYWRSFRISYPGGSSC